jgi:transposase-like protein
MEQNPLTDRMRVIELERGQPFRAVLVELCERGLSIHEMAQELGVSYHAMRDWLLLYGAERRYVLPQA